MGVIAGVVLSWSAASLEWLGMMVEAVVPYRWVSQRPGVSVLW